VKIDDEDMQPGVRGDVRFFDVNQVAQKLGVSTQMIYKSIQQGKLPAIFIGSRYRMTDEDLAQFLSQGRQKARDRAAGRAAKLAAKREAGPE